MNKPSYLLMAFDAENQPIRSNLLQSSIPDLDSYAHDILMSDADASKVMAWLIDDDAFIQRQAQPVVDVSLPWH